MVKHLPAMQETWVQSLGQENPLEKGMATHSSILAWRIPRALERVRGTYFTSYPLPKAEQSFQPVTLDFASFHK